MEISSEELAKIIREMALVDLERYEKLVQQIAEHVKFTDERLERISERCADLQSDADRQVTLSFQNYVDKRFNLHVRKLHSERPRNRRMKKAEAKPTGESQA
jgi:hypothetical protein